MDAWLAVCCAWRFAGWAVARLFDWMLRLAAVAYICFVVHWMICDVRRDHKAVEAVGGLAPVLAKEWQALPAPTVCIASPFDIPELDYTVPPPLEASRGGPCLVHQTYKSQAQLPDQWKINSRAWKTLAQSVPGCQYVFWSDARLRLLIARYYPWFLTAYAAYPYPIQRVDAARYFILYSYGGLYADLDMLPKPTMAAVLARPTDKFVFDHGMGLGVSNDLMLAPPDHPFAALLLTRLRPNSISLLFPYLTVLSTTGSLFCTVNLDLFNRDLAIKRNKFWAVESRRDGHAPTGRPLVSVAPYVGQHVVHQTGNSWHSVDATVFLGVFGTATRLANTVQRAVSWFNST